MPAAAEEKVEYGDETAITKLEEEMKQAAAKLDFERAAELRDRIKAIRQKFIEIGVRD